MKKLFLFILLIICFYTSNCVPNYNSNVTINSNKNVFTDFSYAGNYISIDEGSTHHSKIIITPYSTEGSKIYLSICIIEVHDAAMKPEYRIINDVYVAKNEVLMRGHEYIGKFDTIRSNDINTRILVINQINYCEWDLKLRTNQ